MTIRVFKKYWLHALLWVVMIIYFIYAPDLYTFAFDKTGKPLQTDGIIPAESDQISFVVEDLVPYTKDDGGFFHRFSNLYGWAYILPGEGETADSYVREIVLTSEKKVYFFPVKSQYRNPGPQSLFGDAAVDLNTLGFNTLIAEYTIRPGRYRIGIIFKNTSTGTAFYWDKPARYLVKTLTTLRFERK